MQYPTKESRLAIQQVDFDNEKELETYVKTHVAEFLPCDLLLDGFTITTPSGKGGIPDGFVFDFAGATWYIVEAELLRHGVWDHIAEQIVRFVVASKSNATPRRIRDAVFEKVLAAGRRDTVAAALTCTPDRLLQQLELLIEGTPPRVAIFIDESSQVLADMAEALEFEVSVFRIQKFKVNGSSEYHSPDRRKAVVETDSADEPHGGESDFDVLGLLGSGKATASIRRFKAYTLTTGEVVTIKKSKRYDSGSTPHYWYGINSSTRGHMSTAGVNHVIFVMGDLGLVKVPISVVDKYLETTHTSANADGSVRHHHVIISESDNPEMYWSSETPRFSLKDYFVPFE